MEFPTIIPSPSQKDLAKLLFRSGITLAATLAVTGAPQADAAIIYQSYNQVINSTTPGTTPGEFSVDLDGDSTNDLTFSLASITGGDGQTDAFAFIGSNGGIVGIPTTSNTALLSSGTSIDASSSFNTSNPYTFLASNSYDTGTRTSAGQWYNSGSGLNDGFAGFAFTDGTAQTHYGWARISVAPYNNGDLDSLAITLKDIAYESDANTAIAAGATGIPESSPVAGLIVLGLGGVGVQILRQRQSRRLAKNKPQTLESWEKLALGASSVSQNS